MHEKVLLMVSLIVLIVSLIVSHRTSIKIIFKKWVQQKGKHDDKTLKNYFLCPEKLH